MIPSTPLLIVSPLYRDTDYEPDFDEPTDRDDPFWFGLELQPMRAESYDKIVGELLEMREQTITLVKEAARLKVRAYVLVNNRAEGHAPLTLQALVDRLTDGG